MIAIKIPLEIPEPVVVVPPVVVPPVVVPPVVVPPVVVPPVVVADTEVEPPLAVLVVEEHTWLVHV